MVDIVMDFFMIFTLFYFIFSCYRRYIKKKPLKYEHAFIKFWYMSKTINYGRTFNFGDFITITTTILPFINRYPEYAKNWGIIYIILNLSFILQSWSIKMHNKKSTNSKLVNHINFIAQIVFLVLFGGYALSSMYLILSSVN